MRRTRTRLLVVVGVAIVAAGVLAGVKAARSLPYVPPPVSAARPVSVAAEIAYVHQYWRNPNSAAFGSFDGTDCVNFASQALLARGWPMTADWGHSKTLLGTDAYAKAWVGSTALAAWVGSTALAAWLARHPELAVPIEDDRRVELRVGDLVQVDWDGSGDRDHTGVITRVERGGGDGRIRGRLRGALPLDPVPLRRRAAA